jgi:ribonuclease I
MSANELALHVEAANAHHNAEALRVARDAALLRELAIQARARRATEPAQAGFVARLGAWAR